MVRAKNYHRFFTFAKKMLMPIEQLFKDKSLKPKERTEQLCALVSDQSVSISELIAFAGKAKDPVKATCLESLEYATKTNPATITADALSFAISSLAEKAPRVKWESARVIGNTIHLFPEKIDDAVTRLLDNTENDGTVVRWSAAYALSEILKLKTAINSHLIPAAETIAAREEKNSIKKIYLEALKKIKK